MYNYISIFYSIIDKKLKNKSIYQIIKCIVYNNKQKFSYYKKYIS